jgi:hypothetical protein
MGLFKDDVGNELEINAAEFTVADVYKLDFFET